MELSASIPSHLGLRMEETAKHLHISVESLIVLAIAEKVEREEHATWLLQRRKAAEHLSPPK